MPSCILHLLALCSFICFWHFVGPWVPYPEPWQQPPQPWRVGPAPRVWSSGVPPSVPGEDSRPDDSLATGHWLKGKFTEVTCWISKMRVEIYGSFPNTIYKCLQMVGFPYLECKIPGDLPHIWWEKSKVHSCFPDDPCRLSLQPSGRSARLHISLLLDNRNGTFILALQLLGAVRATDFSGAKVFRGATS